MPEGRGFPGRANIIPADHAHAPARAISISNAPFLQRYFWANAGFGKVARQPGLEKLPWRLEVIVYLSRQASSGGASGSAAD